MTLLSTLGSADNFTLKVVPRGYCLLVSGCIYLFVYIYIYIHTRYSPCTVASFHEFKFDSSVKKKKKEKRKRIK